MHLRTKAKSEDFPLLIVDADRDQSSRRAMEDAIFTSDRMNVAATRLRDRHRAAAAEEDARRTHAYNKVTAARDRLAKELALVYPPLAAQLAELLGRIAANNHEIAVVNSRLPENMTRVLEAELITRGPEGYMRNGVEALSLLRELRLPAFRHDVHRPYDWSPNAPTMPAQQPVLVKA